MKKLKKLYKKNLKKWKGLSIESKVAIIGSIIIPVFIWFFPSINNIVGSTTEEAVVIEDELIELRIGAIKLEKNKKFVLFYSSEYPHDSIFFQSSIPLIVTSTFKQRIDSIEVGFLIPPESRLSIPDYTYDDEPNRVDRYYGEHPRHNSSRYIVRGLNKDYRHFIEEPISLPLSTMKLHLLEGQTYDKLNTSKIRKFEMLNFNDINENDGELEVIWNFQVYSSSPVAGTTTYRLGICRRSSKTREELIIEAKKYLLGLKPAEQANTSAIILFNNKSKKLTSIKNLVSNDTISIPIIKGSCELEDITEIFVYEKKNVLEYNPNVGKERFKVH